jgi:hypothetical protein
MNFCYTNNAVIIRKFFNIETGRNMKHKHLYLICVIIILVIPQIIFAKDWAAKIDDEIISMEDFNKFYYLTSKMITDVETDEEVDKLAKNPAYENHPVLSKPGYLDHLIAQKLLYKKAIEDKTIEQKELHTLLELVKLQTVAQYYLGKKIKNKIIVTEEEVNKIYEENKEESAGEPVDEAKSDYIKKKIKQEIFTQKSKVETNKYIMNLLSESKIDKEGFRNFQVKTEKMANPEIKLKNKE